MTEIVLRTASPHALLSHLALYGLAAILQSQGTPGVRASWAPGGQPRPQVTVPGIDDAAAAALIARHSQTASAEGSWLQRDIPLDETSQALMSPRVAAFRSDEAWHTVQRSRHDVLDDLTARHCWLDLRLLAALGEPCYWSRNKKGAVLQDDGASRLEMQPRNQGSEFIGTRLRKLAASVTARDPSQILAGLRGDLVRDEIGHDKPDSRTATGMAGPGPTDNAIAWCAMWGISQLPLAMRIGTSAGTTGHLRRNRDEWFYAPVWHQPWRPALLRSVLASASLQVVAAADLGLHTDADLPAASHWLGVRGVQGVVRFPVQRFGGDAPERRAMRGEPIPVQGST